MGDPEIEGSAHHGPLGLQAACRRRSCARTRGRRRGVSGRCGRTGGRAGRRSAGRRRSRTREHIALWRADAASLRAGRRLARIREDHDGAGPRARPRSRLSRQGRAQGVADGGVRPPGRPAGLAPARGGGGADPAPAGPGLPGRGPGQHLVRLHPPARRRVARPDRGSPLPGEPSRRPSALSGATALGRAPGRAAQRGRTLGAPVAALGVGPLVEVDTERPLDIEHCRRIRHRPEPTSSAGRRPPAMVGVARWARTWDASRSSVGTTVVESTISERPSTACRDRARQRLAFGGSTAPVVVSIRICQLLPNAFGRQGEVDRLPVAR